MLAQCANLPTLPAGRLEGWKEILTEEVGSKEVGRRVEGDWKEVGRRNGKARKALEGRHVPSRLRCGNTPASHKVQPRA